MNPISVPTSKFVGSVRQLTQLSLVSAGLALLAGCSSTPESHVVSAPPPPSPVAVQGVPQQQTTQSQVVVSTPNGQLPAGTVIVTQAPPMVQPEAVTARPSTSHQWIPGYWTWQNQRYAWVGGHWEVPPSSSSVWVAPRWEQRGDGSYRFYEGYWN